MHPGEYLLANTETRILETWIGWEERIRTKDELLGKAIKDYINVVPQIRIFT